MQKSLLTLERLIRLDATTNAEFWLARELQTALEYLRWANFKRVIHKAMIACTVAGRAVDEHFIPFDEIEGISAGKSRKAEDYALTRYACYLIAQSADSSKEAVVWARSYFALPTRQAELDESLIADQKRVEARRKLSRSEKVLSGLIYEHVEDEQGFRRIHTKGDQAMFGGVTTRQLKRRLHVPKGRALAYYLPIMMIQAKDLANALTNSRIKQDYLHTEAQITREFIKNNREIRKLLGRCKIKPEELPAAEDVKKVARRLTREKGSPLKNLTFAVPVSGHYI